VKLTRTTLISMSVFLLVAPLCWGQDLSKYREFSLGMSLADLSRQIDGKPGDVKVVHKSPALIEEVVWWPRLSGYPPRSEAVREVLFSFCDGKLYRIYVTYDGAATEGMTSGDMARAISARYGMTPSDPDIRISIPTAGYGSKEKVMERWEDAQYSINLLQPSFSSAFALVLIAKQLNAEAETAITAALKVELQGAAQNATDQKKTEADNLEASRVKNVKTFHP
jgi:hypothetical protein